MERFGNFKRYGHATARQTKHDEVRFIRILYQFLGKKLAGFRSILKYFAHGLLLGGSGAWELQSAPGSMPVQMVAKPGGRQIRDFLERTRFFKKVRRARDNFHLPLAAQFGKGFLIQLNDDTIVPPDDEERRRLHLGQSLTREVRSSAPRNYRADPLSYLSRGDQRGTSTGARSKIAYAEIGEFGLRVEPPGYFHKSSCQQTDVESKSTRDDVLAFFVSSQQIE